MVTYVELETELNAQWNAVIIAEPTFYNGDLRNTSLYPAVVFITVSPATLKITSAKNQAYIQNQRFLIKIIAKDLTNLPLYRSEIGRIITSKNVSGGTWSIIGVSDPITKQKRVIQTLTGNENKYTRYTEI